MNRQRKNFSLLLFPRELPSLKSALSLEDDGKSSKFFHIAVTAKAHIHKKNGKAEKEDYGVKVNQFLCFIITIYCSEDFP